MNHFVNPLFDNRQIAARGYSRRAAKVIVALSVLTGASGCASPHVLLPSRDAGQTVLYDQRALTQVQDGIAVTVGSPGPTQTVLNFGVVISNYGSGNVRVNLDDVAVIVNGRRLPMMTLAELQEEIRSVETINKWAAGLSAASVSLSQSNAQQAASATAKREGRALNEQLVDQHKTSAGLLAEAMDPLIQSGGVGSMPRASKLALQSNTLTWLETADVRWQLWYQSTLAELKTREQYFWRSETIAPRRSVLRSVYVNPQAGRIDDLAKAGADVNVQIRVGKPLFSFKFRLEPRSFGESVDEVKTWQQRNGDTLSRAK